MASKTIKPILLLGLFVAFLYMLFYFYDYFLQTSFSILPQEFINKHNITTESFGFLSAAFFYGYVIFQIPLGYCLDRISLKYTSILCAFCCTVGTILFYFATNFAILFLARFMIGAGTACACVMSVYAVSMWLHPKHFFIGVGMVQVAGCLGSIFGQAIGTLLTQKFGWDNTMHWMIYSGFFFLIGLAIASLLIGKCSDYIKSRRKTIMIAFLIQLFCGLYLILNKSLTPLQLGIVLFLLGAAAAVQTLSFVLTAESIQKEMYGTAAALVNMTAASSGGVLNPIFGVIIAHAQNYQTALWIFPVLSFIGITMAFFALKETYVAKEELKLTISTVNS